MTCTCRFTTTTQTPPWGGAPVEFAARILCPEHLAAAHAQEADAAAGYAQAPCRSCGGTGVVEGYGDWGRWEEAPCRDCDGSGQRDGGRCHHHVPADECVVCAPIQLEIAGTATDCAAVALSMDPAPCTGEG